jgi:hypothetical protein
MKTRTSIFLLLSTVITACGGVTPVPVTETPTPKVATQTSTLFPTNTPIATPYNWWETPTPETVPGYPTPLMPVELDPFAKNIPVEQTDISAHDLYIGKYVLRNWCKADESIKSYCAITISSLGDKQVEIWGFPVYLGVETGTDLTGRGYPNIVVVAGIGNAAGEVGVRVFEAGNTLKEILLTGSRRDFKFVDLNDDKSVEFIADKRIWSKFSDCKILNMLVVYEYNPKSGRYKPATDKHKAVVALSVQRDINSLNAYKTQHPNSEVPLCGVYDLVSLYLISGQQEKAWDILDENYSPEKAAEYKAGFLSDLGSLIP